MGQSMLGKARPAQRPAGRRSDLLVRGRDISAIGSTHGSFSGRALVRWVAPLATFWTGTFCVDTTERIAALTYDDGPHPIHTNGILDVLGEFGVHATFFMLGAAARRHPEVAARVANEGHEVGLHGYDHRSIKTMSLRDFRSMLIEARRVVETAAGSAVRLYRPPYLQYDFTKLPLIRALGLRLAMASGGANDWLDDPEDVISERAKRSLAPGAIVLLHDDRGDAVGEGATAPTFDRALVTRQFLQFATDQGYRIVPYSELVASGRGVSSIMFD